MNKEERFYSAEEVSGRPDIDDRVYSESEVTLISDLFSEFYDINAEAFDNDVEKAYSDFFDAYDAGSPKLTHVVPAELDRELTGKPTLVRSVATAGGGALGFAAAKLLNKKDAIKKKELAKKINSGMANKSDLKELDAINKRMRNRSIAGTVVGAGAAYGGVALASKMARNKNYSLSDKQKMGAGAVVGGAVGVGAGLAYNKFVGWSDRKIVNYLEEKEKRDGKLNFFYRTQLKNSRNRLASPKLTKARSVIPMGVLGAMAGAGLASNKNYSEDKLADEFAAYYAECEDIYQDDLENAYNDFIDNNEDAYGFMNAVTSTAGKVATGAARVGSNVAKSAAGTLGSTVKSVGTGALIGAGVNAARGKSIVKGAVAGGVVGGVASTGYKALTKPGVPGAAVPRLPVTTAKVSR